MEVELLSSDVFSDMLLVAHIGFIRGILLNLKLSKDSGKMTSGLLCKCEYQIVLSNCKLTSFY